MRQLFLNKGNLIIKEVAQPLLDDNALLVAVHYVYITSPADVTTLITAETLFNNMPHKVKRVTEVVTARHVNPPKTSAAEQRIGGGYACSGQVIAVGKKVTKFMPGDFVACFETAGGVHADLVCVSELHAVKLSD
jgi:NADPH:quinone reductase-like Zn-dependent oxidoreductase